MFRSLPRWIYPSRATLSLLPTLRNLPAKPDVQQPSLSTHIVAVRLLLWGREFSRATLTGSTNLSHLSLFQFRIIPLQHPYHMVLDCLHPKTSMNVVRSLVFVLLCVRHDDTCSGVDITCMSQSNHM
jgi:hypothetical protein